MTPARYLVHLAGPILGGLQDCSRCGALLESHRHQTWAPGTLVGVRIGEGYPTAYALHGELMDDEENCVAGGGK